MEIKLLSSNSMPLKKCLMEGLDDIALSMEKISKIDEYEKNYKPQNPGF